MTLEFGVDISNWSGEITAVQVECWKAHGITWACVGTQREAITRQQLSVCQAGGLALEAYTYLYFQMDPAGQVREGLRKVADFPIRCHWLDFEDAPGQLGPEEVEHWMWCALSTGDVLAPCPIIPYTVPWWWPVTGDTMAFAGRDAAIADYDGVASLEGAPAVGGMKIVVKQYAGTTDLCEVSVDLDVRLKEEPMVSPELAARIATIRKLLDQIESGSPASRVLYAIGLNNAAGALVAQVSVEFAKGT